MTESLLINVPNTRDFWRIYAAAQRGEAEAINAMRAFWNDYADVAVPCFLCDAGDVERPIFSEAVPDHRHPTKILLLPLCAGCEELGYLRRWHRIIKILGKMWSCRFYWQPSR